MRWWQQYFREDGKRGPFSCVLVEADDGTTDMVTVFWEEIGEEPTTGEEAEALINQHLSRLDRISKDKADNRVVKGVMPEKPSFQGKMVARFRKEANWD